MTGNRVEELEEKVRELEATVSGLTDELVETKERLRLVEEQVEPDDVVEGRASRAGARRQERSQETPQETPQEAVEEAVEDADAGEESAADGAKSEEAEGETDGSEQSDDIIVA